MSDGRKQIFLGSYEGGTTAVIIPSRALDRANEAFDAERKRHEMEASRAKLAVTQAAKARSKLRRAITACFKRGRKGR